MKQNKMRLLTLALAAVLMSVTWSAQADASSPVKALQHFYKEVHTLKTHFQQKQVGSDGQVVRRSSGQFILDRPGRFRWDYTKPYQQSIISNGKTMWIYDHGLQQVIQRSVGKALQKTPALLLSGSSNLTKSFNVKNRGNHDDLSWVGLVPKDSDSGFEWIHMGFRGNQPRRMVLRDKLGQTTHITFTDTKVNVTLDTDRFDFTPPHGVEVVKGAPE